MNSKSLLRGMAVCAVLITSTGSVVPALAQSHKPAGKGTKKTVKVAAAKAYECAHCKMQFTEAEAKKKGYKCCNMKMGKITTAKAGKARS